MSLKVVIDDAPGIGHEIVSIWAWVSTDDAGTGEGIIAWSSAVLGSCPLVFALPEQALKFRPIVAGIVKHSGRPAKLVRFDTRTEIETVTP